MVRVQPDPPTFVEILLRVIVLLGEARNVDAYVGMQGVEQQSITAQEGD